MIRYARAPSPRFLAHLAPGGFLSPLLAKRSVAGLCLDLHFREGNHFQAYCGLTRVIDVYPAGELIRVSAHATYRAQSCGAGLFRAWSAEESGFAEAVECYLGGVEVRQANVLSEGAVQAAWASVTSPWTPFDREAVLGYDEASEQKEGRAFIEVRAARAEIEEIRTRGRWAPMPVGKVGAELDQLAVDGNGRLVLIELKHAGASPGSVFYSPLQLLQYVCEWAKCFEVVRDGLRAVIEARKAIGLSPADMPDLEGGLRSVVGFGTDSRSAEVRARFEQVLGVVNRHLPGAVVPIEAWAMEGQGRPVRIG